MLVPASKLSLTSYTLLEAVCILISLCMPDHARGAVVKTTNHGTPEIKKQFLPAALPFYFGLWVRGVFYCHIASAIPEFEYGGDVCQGGGVEPSWR